MLKLAVIGKDVSKSDSGRMHTFILRGLGRDCSYELMSSSAEDFDTNAKKLLAEYDAFNVTIPYKLDIIPYLDRIEGDEAPAQRGRVGFSGVHPGRSTNGECRAQERRGSCG